MDGDARPADGAPTFIAVGTLHLVGPNDVLTFLHDDVHRVD